MPDTTIPSRGLDPTSSETPWGFKGENYLFVIGIDAYKHWDKLNCAVKDIEDFTEVLLDRYQFKQKNVIALKNEMATKKNILNRLREIAKKITSEDNLILYFSGHGLFDKTTNSAFWIPVNAEKGYSNEDDFLDTAAIVHKLKVINTLHTFLIVDSCFSGTLITKVRGDETEAPKDERHKSRTIFTSGREEVKDGPVGGNSPFSEGILTTLRLNLNPFVSASELIVDVKNYVRNAAKQSPISGTLYDSGDQGGDFVFHLKMDETSLWAFVLANSTVENYEKYLELYPNGKHIEEAKDAIKRAEGNGRGPGLDVYDWIRLQKKPTYKGYSEFIAKYPESGFLKEAQEEMVLLDDAALNRINWIVMQEAKSLEEKKTACHDYLERYVGAQNEHIVRKILNKLNFEGL